MIWVKVTLGDEPRPGFRRVASLQVAHRWIHPAAHFTVTRGRYTIVIDLGHGGPDPGAVGIGGLRETDVVLDVSRRSRPCSGPAVSTCC